MEPKPHTLFPRHFSAIAERRLCCQERGPGDRPPPQETPQTPETSETPETLSAEVSRRINVFIAAQERMLRAHREAMLLPARERPLSPAMNERMQAYAEYMNLKVAIHLMVNRVRASGSDAHKQLLRDAFRNLEQSMERVGMQFLGGYNEETLSEESISFRYSLVPTDILENQINALGGNAVQAAVGGPAAAVLGMQRERLRLAQEYTGRRPHVHFEHMRERIFAHFEGRNYDRDPVISSSPPRAGLVPSTAPVPENLIRELEWAYDAMNEEERDVSQLSRWERQMRERLLQMGVVMDVGTRLGTYNASEAPVSERRSDFVRGNMWLKVAANRWVNQERLGQEHTDDQMDRLATNIINPRHQISFRVLSVSDSQNELESFASAREQAARRYETNFQRLAAPPLISWEGNGSQMLRSFYNAEARANGILLVRYPQGDGAAIYRFNGRTWQYRTDHRDWTDVGTRMRAEDLVPRNENESLLNYAQRTDDVVRYFNAVQRQLLNQRDPYLLQRTQALLAQYQAESEARIVRRAIVDRGLTPERSPVLLLSHRLHELERMFQNNYDEEEPEVRAMMRTIDDLYGRAATRPETGRNPSTVLDTLSPRFENLGYRLQTYEVRSRPPRSGLRLQILDNEEVPEAARERVARQRDGADAMRAFVRLRRASDEGGADAPAPEDLATAGRRMAELYGQIPAGDAHHAERFLFVHKLRRLLGDDYHVREITPERVDITYMLANR